MVKFIAVNAAVNSYSYKGLCHGKNSRGHVTEHIQDECLKKTTYMRDLGGTCQWNEDPSTTMVTTSKSDTTQFDLRYSDSPI